MTLWTVASVAYFAVTVHWQTPPDRNGEVALGQCEAVMACTGGEDGHCEALVMPETCTQQWTLDACLSSSVATPGDDVGDTLGCDPYARVLDVDWSLNP